MLGQLVVTPEVVASKINNINENNSPGVDGKKQTSFLYSKRFKKHVCKS